MNPPEVLRIQACLWPCSQVPMRERYDVAWKTLLSEGYTDLRCHAKCWLTYRAVEGNITLKDWQEQIQPVQLTPIEPFASRWGISQNVVEMYLWIHHGEYGKALRSASEVKDSFVKQFPSNAVNYMRAKAMEALLLERQVDVTMALEVITRAVPVWQKTVSKINAWTTPWHFMEMKDSWEPTSLMMSLAAKHGLVAEEEPTWHKTREHVSQPWTNCLKKVQSLP